MKIRNLVVVAALAATAFAQVQVRQRVERVEHGGPGAGAIMIRHGGPGAAEGMDFHVQALDHTMEFIALDMGGGKPVKGAPYSAEAVTETMQALADGNRISRRQTAQLYRDSEGRTRRQEKLGVVGPWAKSGEPREIISINDPASGSSYVLEPDTKTARKNSLRGPAVMFKSGNAAGVTHEKFNIAVDHQVQIHKKTAAADSDRVKTESLGKRVIEGVEAEGTRTTTTIPAGEIGNDRPIEIIGERWFSQELGTVVMTRRSDPRFGETTYRLSSVVRGEPGRYLFEVPSDYTIKEDTSMEMMRKKMTEVDKLKVRTTEKK